MYNRPSVKARSHCDDNGIFVSLPLSSQMGLAIDKLGTMATGCDVHTVMATAMEKK